MKNNVLYISGPMTGIPDYNYRAFEIATEAAEGLGVTVLSPHVLPLGLSYQQYMDIAMAQVRSCDAILMLEGWSESKGAIAEYHYAQSLGKTITGAVA